MRIILAVLVAPCCAAVASLQGALQDMLTELAASHNATVLQLGWKSATESFNVAAGSVTNPGEAKRSTSTEDTFNYGSGTKPIVAAAVMRMVDAGRLKLDDKVSQYVDPMLKRNNGTTLSELFGASLSEATVLQVIRMEAGIPDFEQGWGGQGIDSKALASHGQVFPPYAWMRAAAAGPSPCAAGACSYYSSTSFEVAGLLLAAIQKPEGDWSDLDLRAAAFPEASRYPSMKLANGKGILKDTLSVAGIQPAGRRRPGGVAYNQNPTIMGWSCGGVNGNTRDFAAFFYDLVGDASTVPIVTNASRVEMQRFKPLTSGYLKYPYGAGLMAQSTIGTSLSDPGTPDQWSYYIGHHGVSYGFHALNGYLPKAKGALSVVTNTDSAGSMITGLSGVAACKASEIIAKYVGGETVSLGCKSTDGIIV